MKDELIEILETFGYPVRLQGSLAPGEAYPPSFFTFWNNETSDSAHYDNHAISYIWSFSIFFYSTDPALVNSTLLLAKSALEASDWIVPGKGYDVASDEPTHTGRGMEAYKIERKEN